jgi:hypothetical protein
MMLEEENSSSRFPFCEMEGPTDIHCPGVDGGRTALTQAIREAIMLLVKPKDRLQTALGADSYR